MQSVMDRFNVKGMQHKMICHVEAISNYLIVYIRLDQPHVRLSLFLYILTLDTVMLLL